MEDNVIVTEKVVVVATPQKSDEERDFIPLVVSKANVDGTKFATATKGGHGHLPDLDEESNAAFILNLFYWKGTVMYEIWPQLLAVWGMMLVASIFYNFVNDTDDGGTDWIPDDAENLYGFLSTILAFLVVFRSNQSFINYMDGRKILGGICNNMREMSMNVFTYRVRPEYQNFPEIRRIKLSIHRHINVLYAVMRQHLRENGEGFEEESQLYHEFDDFCKQEENKDIDEKDQRHAFFAEHWQRDPCSPPISHLISYEEYVALNKVPSAMRPARIEVVLNNLAHELSQYLEEPGFFLQCYGRNIEETVNLFKSAYRIVETPVPMPYRHILYLLCFLATFATPWIYVASSYNWTAGWTACTVVCVSYYGVMELAAKLQQPFGWDLVDLDLEQFGQRVHNETKVIVESFGESPRNYIEKP